MARALPEVHLALSITHALPASATRKFIGQDESRVRFVAGTVPIVFCFRRRDHSFTIYGQLIHKWQRPILNMALGCPSFSCYTRIRWRLCRELTPVAQTFREKPAIPTQENATFQQSILNLDYFVYILYLELFHVWQM